MSHLLMDRLDVTEEIVGPGEGAGTLLTAELLLSVESRMAAKLSGGDEALSTLSTDVADLPTLSSPDHKEMLL